jgi:hypothetical protein
LITANDVEVDDVVSLPGTTWRVPARVVTVGHLGGKCAFTVEDPETGEVGPTRATADT